MSGYLSGRVTGRIVQGTVSLIQRLDAYRQNSGVRGSTDSKVARVVQGVISVAVAWGASPAADLRSLAAEFVRLAPVDMEEGKIHLAVSYLHQKLDGRVPEVLIVLGSGLGNGLVKDDDLRQVIQTFSEDGQKEWEKLSKTLINKQEEPSGFVVKVNRDTLQTTINGMQCLTDAQQTKLLSLLHASQSLAEKLENPIALPYAEIPGFPNPRNTVAGHAGRLVIGKLEGKTVAVMDGRFHLYQGLSAHEVARPLRVLNLLGAKTLVVTNAAGGINHTYKVGDIMLIVDGDNQTGQNPCAGPNLEIFGSSTYKESEFKESHTVASLCNALSKFFINFHGQTLVELNTFLAGVTHQQLIEAIDAMLRQTDCVLSAQELADLNRVKSFPPVAGLGKRKLIDMLCPQESPREACSQRFFAVNDAFSSELLTMARDQAGKLSISLQEGAYVQVEGPNYEWKRQIKGLRRLELDAVGMSTIVEVLAAVHAGMQVLGFSLISNTAAQDGIEPPTHEEVQIASMQAGTTMQKLVRACVAHLP